VGKVCHLTPGQRLVLRDVLEGHPDATLGQVVAIFRARTGRTIGRSQAWRARRRGVPDEPGQKVFTARQLATLDGLIQCSGPRPCRVQVGREFLALTGVSISTTWVARRVREHHHLEPLPPGPQPGTACYRGRGSDERRLAEASARKAAGHRPDNSVRVGRAGRVSGGEDAP
jgi:hypothetical protein